VRKNRRRQVRLGATILSPEGKLLAPCLMADVSGTGARLVVQSSEQIPDQFSLVLSRDGQLRRECHVAWRREKVIGVRFVGDLCPQADAVSKRVGLAAGPHTTGQTA
jgi:hypothetical protein